MTQKQIIGAGLAGLIAACHFKDATIIEAGKRMEQHKALLRFRDKSVSDLTGIPFKEVIVHKEINYKGQSTQNCTIALANMYSHKVAGVYRGRSVWNLETVKRYIAPENMYDRLVDSHKSRILFETPLLKLSKEVRRQIISTIPLPAMMSACGMDAMKFEFERSPIRVDRYRLPKGSDVYQTIYYPNPGMRVFRASITGDLLIVESMTGQPRDVFEWEIDLLDETCQVAKSFGLYADDFTFIDTVDQKYGKIVELPREQREAILYELTNSFSVFSVGRFATWRNILLDDVVKDIRKVEALMSASSYGRGLILADR